MTPVTLRGVQISGVLGVEGKTGTPVITNGVINGALAETDLMSIIDMLAQSITAFINANPTSSTTMTLIGLFENPANPITEEKCMNMVRCCADSPKTCVILPAEVEDSPVGGILVPDIEVFDSSGDWLPVPNGATKNGMSMGFGFTSIKASF
jgi:hypothetical protein